MGREVWGTYAVNDHCVPDAFVRDVMLYDRLVIPTPDDGSEWDRWRKSDWEPDKQARLLDILGDRAVRVPWTAERQADWKNRYEAGLKVAQDADAWAFQATRAGLTANLPGSVQGVSALTAYPSLDALEKDVGLRRTDGISLPSGTVAAIVGRELLVPEKSRHSHEDLLIAALELSGDHAFRRKRAAFWRWQREFSGDGTITDRSAVEDAVAEMQDLVSDEELALRKSGIRTTVSYVILLCSVTVSLLGVPALTPLAATGAFLSIAQFAADHLPAPDTNFSGASLFGTARRHFGWDGA